MMIMISILRIMRIIKIAIQMELDKLLTILIKIILLEMKRKMDSIINSILLVKELVFKE